MISDIIKYSSVTTKARAMYGKRLSEDDWKQLRAAGSLRAVWDILRQNGGWTQVGQDPRCAEDLDAMLEALSRQVKLDVDHLCMFLNGEDSELLRFYLRRPNSMTPEEAKRWWHDGGAKTAGLRVIAGAEADALNLVYLLRLRGFPGTADRAEELLIPVRDKLTPELSRKILQEPSDRRVLEILKDTPWGGTIRSLAPGDLEKQYGAYMIAFCQRALAGARPGLVAAQSFLSLKEMERQRLVRLVTAVSKGIDPNLVV